MSLYAGIDAGTQSLKVVVYDPATKQVIASTSEALALDSRDDGSREQDPGAWAEAMRTCFARIDAAVRRRIVALAVSGQQHGFVALDAEGDVLAPAKLWCDTSTAAECDLIMDAVGGAQGSIALAGNPVMVGYTASKLPWTRRHRSQAYAQLATILLPHDYVNFWLTGERWMECGDASGTGWLDVRTRQWSSGMIAATDPDRDLSGCLPSLVDADFTCAVSDRIADELGLPHGVRVSAGGGDNMMAAIGTGNVSPGVLSMSLGTSGTLFAHADRPIVDDAGRWAAFCDSTGGWLPLICTMNCTVATEAVARLCDFSTKRGDELLAGTRPGAGGLLMLPFFNGERTPNLPDGRGSLFGMTATNLTPANLYRAAMEGAVYSLKNGYDAFVDAGMRFEAIRLTGGGSHSAVWRQMVADVFGLPVDVPEQAEGAAFGAALQALWASERASDAGADLAALAAAHVRLDPRLSAHPHAEATAAYAAQYQRFLSHLDAIRPLYA